MQFDAAGEGGPVRDAQLEARTRSRISMVLERERFKVSSIRRPFGSEAY